MSVESYLAPTSPNSQDQAFSADSCIFRFFFVVCFYLLYLECGRGPGLAEFLLGSWGLGSWEGGTVEWSFIIK